MEQWFRELENRRHVHPQEEGRDARGRCRVDHIPEARQDGFCKNDEPLQRKRRVRWKLPTDLSAWKVRRKDVARQ